MNTASQDPKQSDDRPHPADGHGPRQPRERRSGEGAESALANLRRIERDRQRSRSPEGGPEAA